MKTYTFFIGERELNFTKKKLFRYFSEKIAKLVMRINRQGGSITLWK
jgi:hypothetical protein